LSKSAKLRRVSLPSVALGENEFYDFVSFLRIEVGITRGVYPCVNTSKPRCFKSANEKVGRENSNGSGMVRAMQTCFIARTI
jgi:hypothetical protein